MTRPISTAAARPRDVAASAAAAVPNPAASGRPGRRPTPAAALTATLVSALALAACSDGSSSGGGYSTPAASSAPVTSEGPATPAPAGAGGPDARGVVIYPDYSAVVARRGDTITSMASRVGASPSELAAYNGLPTSYVPTPGDELVLPPRAGGYAYSGGSAAANAPQALSSAPETTGISPAAAAVAGSGSPGGIETTTASGGWSPSAIEGALQRSDTAAAAPTAPAATRLGAGAGSGAGGSDVGYHDVAAGETIYSIARQYGVTTEALISWNALSGPDYAVKPGQVLVIPARSTGATTTEGLYPPGGSGVAAPPPSAGAQLPADTVSARPLASPNLSQYQSPPPAAAPAPAAPVAAAPVAAAPVAAAPVAAAPAQVASVAPKPAQAAPGKLLRPVPGRIVSPYSRSGSGARNDGVDFSASVGEPVKAAADGTVALVSRSLGEWGNIVLIRHTDEMMTVYGRMGDISVTKGQNIAAGQVLGSVGAPASGSPTMHFEVRKGAFSENPEDFF